MIPWTKLVAAPSSTGTLTKLNLEDTRAYSGRLASKTEPYVSGSEFSA